MIEKLFYTIVETFFMSFVIGTALRVLCPAQEEEVSHDGKGGK